MTMRSRNSSSKVGFTDLDNEFFEWERKKEKPSRDIEINRNWDCPFNGFSVWKKLCWRKILLDSSEIFSGVFRSSKIACLLLRVHSCSESCFEYLGPKSFAILNNFFSTWTFFFCFLENKKKMKQITPNIHLRSMNFYDNEQVLQLCRDEGILLGEHVNCTMMKIDHNCLHVAEDLDKGKFCENIQKSSTYFKFSLSKTFMILCSKILNFLKNLHTLKISVWISKTLIISYSKIFKHWKFQFEYPKLW